MARRRHHFTRLGKPFDPNDTSRVKHSKVGLWDMYEEITTTSSWSPSFLNIHEYRDSFKNFPYVWIMAKDMVRLRSCWLLMGVYIVLTVVMALIPAVRLWFSGKMLKIVQTAVETRYVDKELLFTIAAGRLACALIQRLCDHVRNRVMLPLNLRIRSHYSAHIFGAYVRLDVPTFDDPIVQGRLESASQFQSNVAWDTMQALTQAFSIVIQMVSELTVLAAVLKDQRDSALLAALSVIPPTLQWFRRQKFWNVGIWAATCRDEDYVRMQGLKRLVTDPAHRKELTAGGLSEHLTKEFAEAQGRVGDNWGDFYEVRNRQYRDNLSSISLLAEPFKEIPQIVFTLRAVQYPASIPVSLTSLHLIRATVQSFSGAMFSMIDQFGNIAELLTSLRKLYELPHIPNKIIDGKEPYPENQQDLVHGIEVEFRNVSFTYPGSDQPALQNISFKLRKGHLCVIVGTNGSGKSTLLKLITRIYDPSEGEILLDGRDVRTLKLADLRRALSVLFQDYTHFPLSIKENIALGDPDNAQDEEKIEQAAKLGGSYDFVAKLSDGFDTYLVRPVRDYYSTLPAGTTTLFGRPLNHSRVRGQMRADTMDTRLSGGQMQRLALSRTFMRSLDAEDKVGLLLFDEPSASLDPAAEHDLFERLRKLRGNKTMMFSSHRFGNLTRHADLILYMKDSLIEEVGTHDELMGQNKDYARIYNLQAQAFLP